MQCNIDKQGRTARIVAGASIELVGFGLLAWWWLGGPLWSAWTGGATVLIGNFVVIEGAIGWCVVRAMGFRTPI